MKVAVCANGDSLESMADPRFGRCAYFVVVDTDTLESSAVQNPGAACAQGAGIQAAQVVSSLGVSAVVAGNFGPNAYQALSAAGIQVYTGMPGTVRQILEHLKTGTLPAVDAPTVAAHSGMNAPRGGVFGMGGNRGRGRGAGFGRGRGGR